MLPLLLQWKYTMETEVSKMCTSTQYFKIIINFQDISASV